MIVPPESFETEHLFLRRIRRSDGGDIFTSYASHPAVSRYMTWPQPQGRSETESFASAAVSFWDQGKAFHFVIFSGPDNEMVGGFGIEPFPGAYPGHLILGYCFHPDVWGRGYATEVLKRIMRWFHETADVIRLSATVDIENTASGRVLEKAGFVCEGTLHAWAIHPNISAEPRDVLFYAAVKSGLIPKVE